MARPPLTTVEALSDYLQRAQTDFSTGRYDGKLLEPLIDRVSAAIEIYLGRRTTASQALAFTADAATEVLTTTDFDHGLAVDEAVAVLAPTTGALSTGVTAGTPYKVATAPAARTLTLKTWAGAAVDITAAGAGGYLVTLDRLLVPGTGAALVDLAPLGELPVTGLYRLTLQSTSTVVAARGAVGGSGYAMSLADRHTGRVRLFGYGTGWDPAAVEVYARCGYCAIEAQRDTPEGREQRRALWDLEHAALQWCAHLWTSPNPGAERIDVAGMAMSIRPEAIPPAVASLLAPYRRLP